MKMKNMKLHTGAIDYLSRFKMFNGAFSSKIMAEAPLPEGTPQKVKVIVRPLAYLKMVRLIMDFTTEVGWHGLCHRDENDPATYIIEDVMVYPQQVTGTTIKTDEARHTEWYNQFPDEQFSQIRFHGHSHVNMGVFSSGTDDDLQKDLVGMMTKPDDFYIFFIMNKSLNLFIRIYDNKFGVMFETGDVDVSITDGVNDIIKFLRESKEQVKAVTYSYGKNTAIDREIATAAQTNKSASGANQKPMAQSSPSGSLPAKLAGDYDYDDYDDDPLGYWRNGIWVPCEGAYGKGVYA